LGPITGPLTEGVYRNIGAHNLVLASLYGIAIAITSYDLTTFGGHAILALMKTVLL
jgi:hypothetical protein